MNTKLKSDFNALNHNLFYQTHHKKKKKKELKDSFKITSNPHKTTPNAYCIHT